MEANSTQQALFNHIKGLISPNLTLVDVIAEVLNVSNDSAYRRIRGEKPISLDEVQILASHFKISIDQVLQLQTDAFLFSGRITNNSDFKYENWLESVVYHLQLFQNFQPSHLFYHAKEIPFYYYFMIPEIAAFKSYFFMKSILYYEDLKKIKFSLKDDYSRYHSLMQKCSELYAILPSTEIWSIENITSTLNQIEFYRVTGSLHSNEEAKTLLNKLELVIDHIEKQAEYGVKLRYWQEPSTSTIPFKMFVNELIMGDNMQVIQMGNKQLTGINHSVINFVTTTNEAFCDYMKKTLNNIAQKSTLISGVNEKERLLFFNKLRAKILDAKKLIVDWWYCHYLYLEQQTTWYIHRLNPFNLSCSKIGYAKCPKGHFKCMELQDVDKLDFMVKSLL